MKSTNSISLILLVTLANLGNLRASQSRTSVPSFSASSSSATGSIAQASVSQFTMKDTEEDLWDIFRLGYAYCVGEDVAQDGKRAAQYFESIIAKVPMAADLAPSLQSLLGDTYYAYFYLYESGIGVEKNRKRAFEYACKAAQHGNAEALDFLKRSVQKDDIVAAFFLGTLYEAGQGVEKDLERAFLFYSRAATKQCDTEGFNRACRLVRSGNLEAYLTQKLGTTADARRRLMSLVRLFIEHTLIGVVECSVCGKEFNSDPRLLEQPLITNPCMHVLCKDCLNSWRSAKGKDTNCPTCRTPLVFGKLKH